MTPLPDARDIERFRDVVTRRLGLQFEDAKLGFLGEILQRRLTAFGRSAESYLRSLARAPSGDEIGALAQELTVSETYFFRHGEQFRALAEIALPERMRAARTTKTLRLLSAGCASGEEAYSLAIVAREAIADPMWAIAVHAVDVNPAGLRKAERARYSSWALRETPSEVQRQWFRPDGRELVLETAARTAVTFAPANLATDDALLWRPETYDVIFCRNVLMYFAPEQMRAAVARMAQALAPGGFLFLGHAETLRGISDDFHLRHTHETFYYERKDRIAPPAPILHSALSAQGPSAWGSEERQASSEAHDDSWVKIVGDASARVTELLASPTVVPATPQPPQPVWTMAPALDLLRKERFAEALAYVRAAPTAPDLDPDVLLLEAALLVHGGELAAAEAACRRLLLIDDESAGARYLLALCREASGDNEGAAEQHRAAAHLDPAFAMPRLRLGLLARRLGDEDAARRELRHAQILLKSEQPSRLLLFGGGFSRQALIALCASALRHPGGQP